ncbi:hypothetical protein KZC52_07000 [Microbacterium sp. kSW2-24]|uniref:hypothetical protein n=1 Tax=Microbacterium galbinum TaxID=2851646 RepID=UPI001FFDCFF4|nr:hypothetical protein [Microbacterium galbinum]MCK2022664.1 hypothetical protein [Microbacterium galbinum]
MSTAVRPLALAKAVDEALERIDRTGCGAEILRVLRLEAERLLTQVRPVSSSSAMTPALRAFLIESGDFTLQELTETEERVARGELRELEDQTCLETIAASYSESEVAERLGLSIYEVQDRARIGTIYSFAVEGFAVYPKWQFSDQTRDGLLPHLAHVLASLIDGWDPASVQGFMTVPKEDLTYRGEWQTPIRWLLRGGSAHRIDDILEGERWR